MKFYCIFFLLALITSSGCEKMDKVSGTMTPEQQTPMTIQVSEKKTDIPIAGAFVTLEKCFNYDNQFGCTRFTSIASLTTDSSGKVTFQRAKGYEAYKVEHRNYYTVQERNGSAGSVTLTPRCTIKVSLTKEKTYAPNDALYLTIGNADCSQLCGSVEQWIGLARNLPKDTVIFVEAFGNTLNQVLWHINLAYTDSLHPTPPVFINRFDTAFVDIKY